MGKRFLALLFLGWLMPVGAAWAGAPLTIGHTLTGYTMGAETVTVNYTLTVRNSSAAALSNVTLAFVPVAFVTKDKISLNAGNLEPQQEVQIPFSFTTPALLGQQAFSSQPLFWSGTGIDNSGKALEFPASSAEGGAL